MALKNKTCPKCNIAWEEEQTIKEHFLSKGYTEEKATEAAAMYGHTEDNPKHFGKNVVGIETDGYDGTSFWKCTSCGAEFDRWTMKEVPERKFDRLIENKKA